MNMNNVTQMSGKRPSRSEVAKKPRPASKTARLGESGEFPIIETLEPQSTSGTQDGGSSRRVSPKASTKPGQGGCGWQAGETLADAVRKQVAWAMSAVVELEWDETREMNIDEHGIMYALHRVLTMTLEIDNLAHNEADLRARLELAERELATLKASDRGIANRV